MRCIQLQGLRFGEGLPKLCVPLTGNGMPALLSELQQVADLPADLFEWRLDCFFGNPLPVLPQVLENLGDKPLLCTLRTQGEGGQARLSPDERRLVDLLQTGGFGFVDIELSCGEERAARLAELAKSRGISVVLSKHDFHQTPPKEEIAATLRRMKALGADLPKYAVMPRTPGDVLALLAATPGHHHEHGGAGQNHPGGRRGVRLLPDLWRGAERLCPRPNRRGKPPGHPGGPAAL